MTNIDINAIKNSTIAKLDRNEAVALGLLNYGIMLYRGTLKSRRAGWKAEKVSEYQTNFVGKFYTLEFVRMEPTSEPLAELDPQYAMRVKDNETGLYEKEVMPLWGCEFFKD